MHSAFAVATVLAAQVSAPRAHLKPSVRPRLLHLRMQYGQQQQLQPPPQQYGQQQQYGL